MRFYWFRRDLLYLADFETVVVGDVFVPETGFVFLDGSDRMATELTTFLAANMATIEAWVDAGGRLLLNSAPNEGGDIDFGFGGTTLNYDGGASLTWDVNVVDALHPALLGPETPTATVMAGTWYAHALILGVGYTTIIVDVLDATEVVLCEKPWGAGHVMMGGMTTHGYHSPVPAAGNWRSNIMNYLYNMGGEVECLVTKTVTVVGGRAGEDFDTLLCSSPGGTIDLNGYLVGADPGGVWEELTESGQFDAETGVFNSAGLTTDDYVFAYIQYIPEPCGNDTAFFTVRVLEAPVIDAGPDVYVCIGEEILMEAGNPDGAIITWRGGVIDGEMFRPIATGTYIVEGDLMGCMGRDEMLITMTRYPEVTAGDDVEVCQFDPITLNADNPDGAIITWDPLVVDGEAFVPDASGTYTVTADILGCTTTDELEVTVNPLPFIVIAATPFSAEVCMNDEVTLTGTGAGAGGTYAWDLGVLDGEAFTPTLGTTTYTVTGTDANGCMNAAAINVKVNPLPIVSFTADTSMICNPDFIEFTNTTDLPGVDCVWNFGDGATGTGCGTVSHFYNTVGDMDVKLEVTTAEGCVSSISYDDFITVFAIPEADFVYTPQPINVENTQVSFRNKTEFATNYEWFFGDGSGNSTEENPIHYYPEIPDMTYEIMLIAKNDIGCTDSVTKKLYIEDVVLFFVPNAFTPDGNGFNENFKPIMTSGIDFYDYHFTVFNRWGEKMFESFDAFYGWDGTYGSAGIVESGVYVWQIEFGDRASDKKHLHRGQVTVMK